MKTVTTYAKYLKIVSADASKYIYYAGLVSIDAIANASIAFNAHDSQFQQFTRATLNISDIDTFDGSNSFTADSIAAAINAKVIA